MGEWEAEFACQKGSPAQGRVKACSLLSAVLSASENDVLLELGRGV